MKKKHFLIIILIFLTLSSCTRVEIVTDSYWTYLVSDFQGTALKLKIQSFIRGVILSFTVIDIKDEIPDLTDQYFSQHDIYILSPLLSSKAFELSDLYTDTPVYYFGLEGDSITDSADNLIMIKRDRKKSFFEAGKLLSKELEENFYLPVIYSTENQLFEEEALSFFEGLNDSGKNINLIPLKVTENSAETEIRNFFDKEVVKNSRYIVVFTNKWRNICFELSERDSKSIITSDSWFLGTYASFILFSIEDDIIGMLNKVYSNAKRKRLTDITLKGHVFR
ncbi:MAG: hypothetical protein U9N32_08530 [Spirochaetota bacterium]|nr:hypothetical protein [Spirochaetota bacterium]